MLQIEVDKTKLVEILKSNRESHREVVEDAWDGFRKEAIKILDKKLAEAKKGLKKDLMINLRMPEDHTDDYDRALGMMKMELRDKVMLDEDEYAQYVDDDWGWRNQWLTSNASYTTLAKQR